MGILDRLGFRSPPSRSAADTEPGLSYVDLAGQLAEKSVEQLWHEQPHLRTVTSFIARMVATVSLHVYEREPDGGRVRVREGDLAYMLRRPNDTETFYQFLYDSVLDLCLYDEFIWIIAEDAHRRGRYVLERVSPRRVVDSRWKNRRELAWLGIDGGRDSLTQWVPAAQVIRSTGYSPWSVRRGDSPVNALRTVLKEQIESAAYRAQLWHNGPRLGGVITRPAGANWDAVSRRRFKQSWQATYAGAGSGAGGVPVLEDGMEFKPFHLSAQDEQVAEMTKLSLSTVAQVYHINPTMVGLLDNANYSNVREFRQSLYGDSLGPVMKLIEELLNFDVLPRLAEWDPRLDPSRVYMEFNVEERLRGRFEEQAEVTSKAVGAPWMTRNEARAMNNLPRVDGGDELIVPLNVAEGDAEDEPPSAPTPDDDPKEGDE
ncbi:phage portal protein [Corynebacterium imitans]|uniref:phage portal protein n=1 Tax=Corynebacterium imitans TaxID=156978 RepID=UPI00254B4978|nr:phage portal protein [Corynebacterium imitans]MDK8637525.1 phage portal protein [Corynebacterium imitans]MDK8772087.1 phage portal protein [Corynebacterium imitans]